METYYRCSWPHVKPTEEYCLICETCLTLSRYYAFGQNFGYPLCCINEFVLDISENRRCSPIRLKVSKGSGFVPCGVCAEKILSKKVTLKELVVNRYAKYPFTVFSQNRPL